MKGKEIIRDDLNGEKVEYDHDNGEYIIICGKVTITVSAYHGYIEVKDEDKHEDKPMIYMEFEGGKR